MKQLKIVIQPLLLVVLILILLILLKSFLISFAYGLLLALIAYPVCKKLEAKKMSRSVAIFISVCIMLLIGSIVLFIFALQVRVINKELPSLMWRLEKIFPNVQKWVSTTFDLSFSEQDSFINAMQGGMFSTVTSMLSGIVSTAGKIIFSFVIIPLYTILILYYRKMLIEFISSFMNEKYKKRLSEIVSETVHMYFHYIKGMAGVYFTVGILNSIGLLILGVDYAIVFGMVTAFMTIVPYVGIIISSILPIAMIWAETNNILYPVGVVAIFAFVQYLEANLLFPYIVGKQIGLNMFISIIAILLGGVIWGLSGMVLFLPFVAIAKIVFSHVEELKPINKLLET